MRYFLDFDGVIFNIEAFKARMEALGFAEAPRSAALFDAMKKKDPQFLVSSFVYDDAVTFLHAHREYCYVVSSYVSSNPLLNQDEKEAAAYQTEKISLAGVTELLGNDHIHVVGKSKQEALAVLHAASVLAQQECTFIDDRKEYVREALELGMHALLMDRKAQEQGRDVMCISSFEDLKTLSSV